MRRFVPACRIDGVPLFIHWTLVLGCALLVVPGLRSLRRTAPAVAGVAAYFAAMLLHEWGHVVLARQRKYHVYGIELYPFVGLTRLERPRSRVDHCIISWGGLLFQAALGIPLLAWILFFGYTPLEAINAFMAVLAISP
jgi:hypothetical protein